MRFGNPLAGISTPQGGAIQVTPNQSLCAKLTGNYVIGQSVYGPYPVNIPTTTRRVVVTLLGNGVELFNGATLSAQGVQSGFYWTAGQQSTSCNGNQTEWSFSVYGLVDSQIRFSFSLPATANDTLSWTMNVVSVPDDPYFGGPGNAPDTNLSAVDQISSQGFTKPMTNATVTLVSAPPAGYIIRLGNISVKNTQSAASSGNVGNSNGLLYSYGLPSGGTAAAAAVVTMMTDGITSYSAVAVSPDAAQNTYFVGTYKYLPVFYNT